MFLNIFLKNIFLKNIFLRDNCGRNALRFFCGTMWASYPTIMFTCCYKNNPAPILKHWYLCISKFYGNLHHRVLCGRDRNVAK